ncbi:hypothetical protein E7Z54_03615, partial [Nocardioides sp.]
MGLSLPPRASIDLVASFARIRDDRVEIVLAEPVDVLDGEVWAELWRLRGEDRVRCSLELASDGDARRYVVSCPRSVLGDGRWGLSLHNADESQRVNARLLVQGDRPLCLLWGARAGASRPPVPFRDRPKPVAPTRPADL